MLDLVGIGSINVDLIVSSTPAAAVDLGHPDLGLTPDDAGNEVEVDPEAISRALTHLSRFEPVISPGGSSLNVVAAVAASGAPLSVGYVGVLGTADPANALLPTWLADLGIDDSLIETVDGPPGSCLAINHGAERTLLTTGGVNDRLDRLLIDRRADVVATLTEARMVHLTSLAGLDDLSPLVEVLDAVRLGDPGARLSCDPGAIWTSERRGPGAEPVLARCHQLLVNRREFEALGGGPAVFDRFRSVELVVVKGSDRVDIHRRTRSGRPDVERHINPWVLGPDDIVDDTGSGDAFAAGFLIGQLTGQATGEFDPERTEASAPAVGLGMEFARLKMGFPGVTRIERFAPAYRQWRGSDR